MLAPVEEAGGHEGPVLPAALHRHGPLADGGDNGVLPAVARLLPRAPVQRPVVRDVGGHEAVVARLVVDGTRASLTPMVKG